MQTEIQIRVIKPLKIAAIVFALLSRFLIIAPRCLLIFLGFFTLYLETSIVHIYEFISFAFGAFYYRT